MSFQQIDNRDPRWSCEVNAAIEEKVAQTMASKPRLELAEAQGGALDAASREVLLRTSFREIVKATSLDTLMTAPPALLEQVSVLALVNNENIKGILVQLIRVYLMLWGAPETNAYARTVLLDMERMVGQRIVPAYAKRPQDMRWKPMP